MSFSQAQLDAIDAAISAGELTVRIGDRSITYRSMSELERARRVIQRGLDAQSGRRRSGYALADFRDA